MSRTLERYKEFCDTARELGGRAVTYKDRVVTSELYANRFWGSLQMYCTGLGLVMTMASGHYFEMPHEVQQVDSPVVSTEQNKAYEAHDWGKDGYPSVQAFLDRMGRSARKVPVIEKDPDNPRPLTDLPPHEFDAIEHLAEAQTNLYEQWERDGNGLDRDPEVEPQGRTAPNVKTPQSAKLHLSGEADAGDQAQSYETVSRFMAKVVAPAIDANGLGLPTQFSAEQSQVVQTLHRFLDNPCAVQAEPMSTLRYNSVCLANAAKLASRQNAQDMHSAFPGLMMAGSFQGYPVMLANAQQFVAFAAYYGVGGQRENTVIVLTTGLVQQLEPLQPAVRDAALQFILGHEAGHVNNLDQLQSDIQAGVAQEVRADAAGLEYLRSQGIPRDQIWAGATAVLDEVFAAGKDDPVAELMKQARVPAIGELLLQWDSQERNAQPVQVAQRGG